MKNGNFNRNKLFINNIGVTAKGNFSSNRFGNNL
jgi:hypothetical protein